MRAVRGRRAGLVVLVLVLATACGSGAEDGGRATPAPSRSSADAEQDAEQDAAPPVGWRRVSTDGISLAVPGSWDERPQDRRVAPQASVEVGEPYTDQPHIPPALFVFVEAGQVGPLEVREPVTRATLEAGLPGAVIGESAAVDVTGAVRASTFDVRYASAGGTSFTGVVIPPSTIVQRELLVETDGDLQYGVRYAASESVFDEDVWAQVLDSLEVAAPGAAAR